MSVDKPVRPASEVAATWLRAWFAEGEHYGPVEEESLTKLLQEVRAAALGEAKQIAISEAMNTLHRVDVKTRDPIAIGEIQKMIDLIARALATRSTEEPVPEEKV